MVNFVGRGMQESLVRGNHVTMTFTMTPATKLLLLLYMSLSLAVVSLDPCDPEGGYEIIPSVRENLPVSSVIHSLKIPGNQSEVDLVGQNSTYFQFDPVSRNITLKKALDRDTSFPGELVKYFVNCKAKKDANFIKINFRVVVLDVNDNAPKFTQDQYEVHIKESLAVGDSIITGISAVDNDSGNNGLVYYSVLDGPYSHYFDIINPVKANLKLIKKLDYETENNFTIQIVAQDQADQESPLNDTALVTIRVIDEDDMPPKFSRARYTGTVIENSKPGTVVEMAERIVAYDQDISFNNSVVYSMMDPQNMFAIDRLTAEVRVNRTPTSGVVSLFIQATQVNNKQQSGVSVLKIRVIESNMNAPSFQQQLYTVTVPENTPVGTTVLKVTATDKDYGANIFYGIDTQNTFKMDENSGFIVVKQPLDYEGQKRYDLQVTATDGMSTAYAVVEILIADVNDNNPVIKYQEVDVSVQRELGTVITQIEAQDLDNNTLLTYSLLAHYNIFGIDSAGYITIINADNIDEDVYVLAVTVTDNGNPPRQSVATVTVRFPPLPRPAPVAMAGGGSDILAIAFGVIAAILLITVTILVIYIIRRRQQANQPLDKAKINYGLDPKGLLYHKNMGSRSASRVNLNFRGDHEETTDGYTTIATNPFTIGQTAFRGGGGHDDNCNYGFLPNDKSETNRDVDEIQIETAVIPYGPGADDSFYHSVRDGFPQPEDEDDSFQDKLNHSFANGSLSTFKNSSSNESLHSDGAGSKTMLMNSRVVDGKKPMGGKNIPWNSNGHLASMKSVHSIDPNTGVAPMDEKPEITVYF
ncbi:cadherin EGF LAG seven-pass G-type receptor 2-like isoform X2 [Gigantopelta aegis]|uniref:cadherin EGF LAG seven-pass G-type receptor 2-like isoform X2 n=1 Tax=Gigantopelta aegis TaxID=1735272 RepID=UPI001B88D124|nr:cadherin EGF LAG seven-pass G-type receptor 2-like isoform X2 [Gigantopelta aegis]